jgi:parallel beta-helix repeat protein
MRINRIITITILFSLLILPIISFENGISKDNQSIIYVGGYGEGNFTSIQSAINNASDGGIIYLYINIYLENIIVNKQVTIIGQEKESCIIDGTKTDNVVTLNAENIKMDNITILNSKRNISFNPLNYAGILIKKDNNIISNCDIRDSDIAINLINSSNNKLIVCRISKNAAGINLYNSSNNLILNCSIFINNLTHGISLQNSNNNNITKCSISENNICGIALSSSSNNKITLNNIYNNTNGVCIFLTLENISTKNIFFNNNLIKNNINVIDDTNNFWDNNKKGNYWDDYQGIDTNNDGIGETPYNINIEGNKDNYPLIKPINIEWITYPNIKINNKETNDENNVPGFELILLLITIIIVIFFKTNFKN